MINIKVTGVAGAGKSTISNIIATTLRTYGFDVDLLNEDSTPSSVMDNVLAIKNHDSKIIVTTQSTRS